MKQGLECRRLSFNRLFPDGSEKPIICGLNAAFAAGHLAHIAGETGAGKSTLLHLLAGLLRPTEGEVLADGQPVSRWVATHRDLWRRKVGIVFQSDRLVGDLSALENVYLPLIPRGYRMFDCRALAVDALVRLRAGALADEKVSRLSGGERQRVAIARALVSKPPFILADEPTAHQDRESAVAVIETLRAAAAGGAVVIVTAHDARLLAPGIMPHRYRIEGGRLRVTE